MIWGVTDNLGDWAVIRKRINDELQRKRHTPLARTAANAFQPFSKASSAEADAYFAREMGAKVREASRVGWSPENPAKVTPGEGKHTWNLSSNLSPDAIMVARHAAPSDDSKTAAPVQSLARRAQGRSIWGVLRGDVDNFGLRLRRVHSIEEHVPLSVLYKQFFAGELEVLCSMPEFWRKASILYCGGDDFAVYGSWDALIGLAREVQRLFHRFTEENLKEYPGAEGKTISMAIALAPETNYPLASIYQEAGPQSRPGQGGGQGLHVPAGANSRLAASQRRRGTQGHGHAPHSRLPHVRASSCINCAVSTATKLMAESGAEVQRTWRFQRRFNRVLSGTRDREFQKLRAHLINELVGRRVGRSEIAARGFGGPGVGPTSHRRISTWQNRSSNRNSNHRRTARAARRAKAVRRAKGAAVDPGARIAADRMATAADPMATGAAAATATVSAPKVRPRSSSKS